jgi:hypothetical protein
LTVGREVHAGICHPARAPRSLKHTNQGEKT